MKKMYKGRLKKFQTAFYYLPNIEKVILRPIV